MKLQICYELFRDDALLYIHVHAQIHIYVIYIVTVELHPFSTCPGLVEFHFRSRAMR